LTCKRDDQNALECKDGFVDDGSDCLREYNNNINNLLRNNNSNFTAIASSSPLADFVRVEKSEMMLLGAPVTKGKT